MSDTTQTTGEGAAAYDAAKSSPNRSSFVAYPTNSRRELTTATWKEIIKKSRALEANCAMFTRVLRKSSRHAVGSGIHFRCLSDDETFNDAMRRGVEEWWNNPLVYSIDGSVDGWTSKRMLAEAIMLDGEGNAVFANHPESRFPAIQMLDVFEIETPPLRQGEEPRDWDNGFRVNAYERPIETAVRTLAAVAVALDALDME